VRTTNPDKLTVKWDAYPIRSQRGRDHRPGERRR
jgi:hypothetical protein